MSRVSLIRALGVFSVSLLASYSAAQNGPDPIFDAEGALVPAAALGAVTIGMPNAPELYYTQLEFLEDGTVEREYLRMPIRRNRRTQTVTLILEEEMFLYARSVSPETQETEFVPYIQIPSMEDGDELLLVFHYTMEGTPTHAFLDEGLDIHPTGEVRFVNFSPWRTAVSIGRGAKAINPYESALIGVPNTHEGQRYFLRYAAQLPNGTFTSPRKPLTYRDNRRLLILYTGMPQLIEEYDDEGIPMPNPQRVFRPIAYRLYDRPEPSDGEVAENNGQQDNRELSGQVAANN